VFRKWGRIGTKIGDKKLETFTSKSDAKRHFEKLYYDKTGNEWANRHNFVKQPGRFYPLELDFGVSPSDSQNGELQEKKFDKNKTKLPPRLASLIELIFDIKAMRRTLIEMEIDIKKMPLGKLSRSHILKGYNVLTEIQELLKQNNPPYNKLLDCSNRFYTIIPHNFGISAPPLIDNETLLKDKIKMLDTLLEMEIATKVLQQAADEASDDPLEDNYRRLHCELTPLDQHSEEWKIVSSRLEHSLRQSLFDFGVDMGFFGSVMEVEHFVKNTHAPTHDQYTLKIVDIFKVEREGEEERYRKKYGSLSNKRLLWHGSRLTNFVGILSQVRRLVPGIVPLRLLS